MNNRAKDVIIVMSFLTTIAIMFPFRSDNQCYSENTNNIPKIEKVEK